MRAFNPRKTLTGIVGAAVLSLLSQTAAAANLVIGTSSPGGSYFLMGGGLSTAITRDVKGITLSTRTTAGSTTNLRLLGQPGGGIEIGMSNLAVVYNAVGGTGKFKDKPIKNIRALMALSMSPLHWVTLADDKIMSFSDLKGKRVSLAKAGSGTAANAELVLRAIGIREQIDARFLGFSEAGNALRDGNLDVFAVSSSVPVPVVTALSATRKLRILSLNPDELKAVLSKNPAFNPYTIKASAYGDNVVADAQSFGVPSTIIARSDIPDDVIYKIVMYVFTKKTTDYMKTVYKTWSAEPGVAAFAKAGVTLHPGAVKAYKELGLM